MLKSKVSLLLFIFYNNESGFISIYTQLSKEFLEYKQFQQFRKINFFNIDK